MYAIIQRAEAEAHTKAWNILGETNKQNKNNKTSLVCYLENRQGYTLIRQGEQEVTTRHE